MKEQLIAFETAKLAKKKGFNEICTNVFKCKDSGITEDQYNLGVSYEILPDKFACYLRPNQSLLQKWLREEHNIFVQVILDQISYVKFGVDIIKYKGVCDFEKVRSNDLMHTVCLLHRTYEKALEEGLLYALTLI